MNTIDLEHMLLYGNPFPFESLFVHNIKLSEMVNFKYGYSYINSIMNIFSLSDAEVLPYLSICPEKSPVFYFIYNRVISDIQLSLENDDDEERISFYDASIEYLKLLFKTDIIFDEKYGFIVGNKVVLNENNFDEFKKIIKLQYCLNNVSENDFSDNPANEMARKLIEKRNKCREKINQMKKNSDNENQIGLSDLISIFSEEKSVSPRYIYDNYDLYQFNDQFGRLKIMDEYHVNIQVLLAGAKKEGVNYRHWITKQQKQKD